MRKAIYPKSNYTAAQQRDLTAVVNAPVDHLIWSAEMKIDTMAQIEVEQATRAYTDGQCTVREMFFQIEGALDLRAEQRKALDILSKTLV